MIKAETPPTCASWEFIHSNTRNLPPFFRDLVDIVLNDERFTVWPGSCDKNHAHDRGLVDHTAEVFNGCLFTINAAKVPLNETVLKVAAVWHDYGKLWDYERNPIYCSKETHKMRYGGVPYSPTREQTEYEWQKTSAGTYVRHLSRSYLEFMMAADQALSDLVNPEPLVELIEPVAHCILSHHGRLAWGSPVEPKTPEAWALHLADMLSVQCLAEVKSPNEHP